MRRARLVCKQWRLSATFQALSKRVQPHVVDMRCDSLLWKRQLSTGARMLPQLESLEVKSFCNSVKGTLWLTARLNCCTYMHSTSRAVQHTELMMYVQYQDSASRLHIGLHHN
jgi:hypothetical protein